MPALQFCCCVWRSLDFRAVRLYKRHRLFVVATARVVTANFCEVPLEMNSVSILLLFGVRLIVETSWYTNGIDFSWSRPLVWSLLI